MERFTILISKIKAKQAWDGVLGGVTEPWPWPLDLSL